MNKCKIMKKAIKNARKYLKSQLDWCTFVFKYTPEVAEDVEFPDIVTVDICKTEGNKDIFTVEIGLVEEDYNKYLGTFIAGYVLGAFDYKED